MYPLTMALLDSDAADNDFATFAGECSIAAERMLIRIAHNAAEYADRQWHATAYVMRSMGVDL